MKIKKILLINALSFTIVMVSCKGINKMQTGAGIGESGGGVIGAMIGKASGNSEIGAVIGTSIGGVTGEVIGRKMDTQATELKKEVSGVKVERVGEGIIVEFNNKILFDVNQSDLSVTSEKSLDELARVLQKYPDTNIEIQGYTDNKGSVSYNQILSQKRATSVAIYLKNKGIAGNRVISKGMGQVSPKYSNDSETGRSENRRVELVISANEKMREDTQKEVGINK